MSEVIALRRLAATAAAVTIAAILAACGGGTTGEEAQLGTDDSAPAETSEEAAPPETDGGDDGGATDTDGEAVVVTVSAFEFGYEFVAPTTAGTYTFEVVNDGTMQHDLVIEGGDVAAATAVIEPSQIDSLTVELPPGEYTIYCSIGTHRAQGMEVTFTVS